jgi:uncharacterized membrane protein
MAYATGAAVMALPWVLTTIVLVSLPLVVGRDMADLVTGRWVVTVAYAVALLVAGPIQIVVSRYSADRLYEGRLHAIAAPLCRGIGVTILVCAFAAGCGLLALRVPLRDTLCGVALAAAVGAQWTALSVGNGLCSPSLVLGAVGAGSGLSFVLAAVLASLLRLGTPGYLFGLIAGQTLTLVVLLVGIFRALPQDADESARLLPAFRDFAELAGAGLAFNASLWADRVLVWSVAGGEVARRHIEASTLAWFSTIPCLAWVFVEVETKFHRRFRRFYSTLEGGASLSELRAGVRALEDEASRLLRGAVSVQVGVTLFLQLAVGPWARWAGIPPEAVLPYRLLLLAAGAQAVGLLGLIVLYYFDLRREACLAALGLFIGVTTCTFLALRSGLPPSVGTALGCALGATAAWRGVFRGVRGVLQHTLLAQPYGAERGMRPARSA